MYNGVQSNNEAIEMLERAADRADAMLEMAELTATDARAIARMLKEQEAVKPILIREGRNKNYNDYVCPRCDNNVVYEQNYCSECGVQFLWEGR